MKHNVLRQAQTALVLATLFISASAAIAEPVAPVAANPPMGDILTPAASPSPRINGPTVFGVRPGSPFVYTIPATGERPIEFSADALPAGLKLDSSTGQITGVLNTRSTFPVTWRASNARGKAEKAFKIIVGDQISLTPPMGWNSWNSWGDSVSQDKVLSSAKAMIDKGLKDHGWSYINIDDGWQAPRGGDHNALQANPKFPDMKALADEVHGMGLKFGIYSTPWVMSYAGYPGGGSDDAAGTYPWIVNGQHNENFRLADKEKVDKGKWRQIRSTYWHLSSHSFAENDAMQWATWGVDYLKYDWNPNDTDHTAAMSKALQHCGRDVIFSLSNSAPFDHAADWQRLSNVWRTTGDIVDTWDSVLNIGFHQKRWASFAGPGHWNDPDMLVVGQVGWGHPHPTRLTHDEQYSHMSLWCLLSAPLLTGSDLTSMDDFTVSLLSNDEVLEIDQDALGQEATPVAQDKSMAIYSKPLEDGSMAIGLFNLSPQPQTISVKWADVQRQGQQRVRDLWRQQDLGTLADGYSCEIPTHGVRLLRVFASP